MDYCLREAGLTPEQLDYVVFYDKPFLKFDRLLETYLAFAPRGFRSFMMAMPLWLKTKLHLPREIRKALGWPLPQAHRLHRPPRVPRGQRLLPLALRGGRDPHHGRRRRMGHRDDRRGARATGSSCCKTLHFPHSLGLLYSAFTYFCGFKVNSGEYKLMGLAPYGEPRYADLILEKLVDLKEDGSLAWT